MRQPRPRPPRITKQSPISGGRFAVREILPAGSKNSVVISGRFGAHGSVKGKITVATQCLLPPNFNSGPVKHKTLSWSGTSEHEGNGSGYCFGVSRHIPGKGVFALENNHRDRNNLQDREKGARRERLCHNDNQNHVRHLRPVHNAELDLHSQHRAPTDTAARRRRPASASRRACSASRHLGTRVSLRRPSAFAALKRRWSAVPVDTGTIPVLRSFSTEPAHIGAPASSPRAPDG